MLLERGIDVSYETVRHWIAKFGPQITRNLRRRQARHGGIWYLDEVAVKCAGEKFWLWRAVDQHGFVLEEILQKRRDKRAAKRLLVVLMKRYGFSPQRIITDKLRCYGAAKAEVAPGLDHWSHKGLNNRAENSHLPFRKRERTMQGHRCQTSVNRRSGPESEGRIKIIKSDAARPARKIRDARLNADSVAHRKIVNICTTGNDSASSLMAEDHRFLNDEWTDAAMTIIVNIVATYANDIRRDAHIAIAKRQIDIDIAQSQFACLFQNKCESHVNPRYLYSQRLQ
ncbi:Mobile element protein [Ochrobactrum soli]|uniref:Mobile element protein n=1 Tax=Ochrobactrum soli TaxID=2448455 RepID=A0A2P9HBL8_9HYPH|nr:Mobile element protein [[Ochrobactrum] soli]